MRTKLSALFSEEDAHKRGKAREGILNELFKTGGISVRDGFVLRVNGEGIVEQIEGVIELDGHLYLVEMKWWKEALGPGEVAQHLVRVFNRGQSRGIFVSASSYTAAAIISRKESLARAVIVLCDLGEFVHFLEQDSLCVLHGGRFRTLAVTDLLRSELAAANAATPARRRAGDDYRPWLLIGAPGSHQFAATPWTLSLNHKLLQKKRLPSVWKISCQDGSYEPPQR